MDTLVVKMNRRALLLPGSLPRPQNAFAFRDAYRRQLEEVLPREILNSATPPTDADIDAAADKLWTEKYAKKMVFVGEKAANEEAVEAEFNAELEGLPDRLRLETARTHKVYIEPGAIVPSQQIVAAPVAPSPQQIWFAQSALWVQQDVAASIAAVNAEARDILAAPVKHLVALDVPEGIAQYTMPAAAAAVADASAPLPVDFAASPTGRVSNSLYDVVGFRLVLNVDARKVPALLKELSRDKLMTVKVVDLTSVNTAAAREMGFHYGTAPVVRLTLEGEALLMRAWTTPLIPEDVKRQLPAFLPPAPAGEAPVAAR
jgi:hypothetical protein